MIQMLWKLAECCEDNGDIEGALLKTKQATACIDALKAEKKITNFDTYRGFFEKQTKRLTDKQGE